MSLDDLPAGAPPRHEPEMVVRRVDPAAPYRDKITRAEELRLQLADEIVRGVLPPAAARDETDIARRFNVSRTRVRVHPFRRAQFQNLGRLAKSHAEHDRVVVAIMRGDRPGATAAMRAHIELVRDEYEIYAVSV